MSEKQPNEAQKPLFENEIDVNDNVDPSIYHQTSTLPGPEQIISFSLDSEVGE